eukprot:COSAG02_NODE_790_length_17186_cov_791.824603_6_plen_175_part_00
MSGTQSTSDGRVVWVPDNLVCETYSATECDNTGGTYTNPTTDEATNDEIEARFDGQEPRGGTIMRMADIRRVCYRPHERRRKRNSEAIVNTLSQSTEMVEGLRDLLDEQAIPFLKCSFVSEMFADLFIPLCVDAFGGFSLISGANVVSNIALIIIFLPCRGHGNQAPGQHQGHA